MLVYNPDIKFILELAKEQIEGRIAVLMEEEKFTRERALQEVYDELKYDPLVG